MAGIPLIRAVLRVVIDWQGKEAHEERVNVKIFCGFRVFRPPRIGTIL